MQGNHRVNNAVLLRFRVALNEVRYLTLHAILRHSEGPHFAYVMYLCVTCDCGNSVAIIPLTK